jgi:uncharacterized protein (TIGR02757 family)
MPSMKGAEDIRAFLDRKVEEYNRPSFITDDPICIPRRYTNKQDIEIAGFFAAIFSWGNRTTIIRKSRELMQLMDDAPYDFVRQHQEKDLRRLLDFRHRTFNATDLLFFIAFFKAHYADFGSLEDAFLRPWERKGRAPAVRPGGWEAEEALSAFRHYFFSVEEAPPRTYKHISTPEKNSSCKRLNMFLRWMVRSDDRGVDFGIWKKISPARLICPLDLHVARVAKRFGLLSRKPTDWQAALELTERLSRLDPEDPVKYDFALFGLGVMEKFQ